MGIQKYRFDRTGEPGPNGAIPLYSEWMGGHWLAGIRDCPCSDGKRRTVYVTDEADTFWTQPAAVAIKGRRCRGYICSGPEGLHFTFTERQPP